MRQQRFLVPVLVMVLVGAFATPGWAHDRRHGHGHDDGDDEGRPPAAAMACRNSYDERCGTFQWSPPAQANDPAHVTITFSPEQPQPGETVTFRVVVTDPDAGPRVDEETIDYGDGDAFSIHCDSRPGPHGPWTPPAQVAHRSEHTFTHEYAGAGDYDAVFAFDVGCTVDPNPYRSVAGATVTVPVREQLLGFTMPPR